MLVEEFMSLPDPDITATERITIGIAALYPSGCEQTALGLGF
jgi:hypothetical protein